MSEPIIFDEKTFNELLQLKERLEGQKKKQLESAKRWKENNKDKVKEYFKSYYKKNYNEKFKEAKRRYYQNKKMKKLNELIEEPNEIDG
jgi:hypothetical protein